jgi:hypothetical protein
VSFAATPLKCTFYGDHPWEDIPKDENSRPIPGAMFWIHYSSGHCDLHEPACTQHLTVVTPDGHWWVIDGRASNCGEECAICSVKYREHTHGSTDDHRFKGSRPTHRCWVRHGVPPNITVDKNGGTCDAGGGSIQTPAWHGFLREGTLVT